MSFSSLIPEKRGLIIFVWRKFIIENMKLNSSFVSPFLFFYLLSASHFTHFLFSESQHCTETFTNWLSFLFLTGSCLSLLTSPYIAIVLIKGGCFRLLPWMRLLSIFLSKILFFYFPRLFLLLFMRIF